MFTVGKTFVSIRMIIVDPKVKKSDFEKWMIKETGPGEKSFLDKMGGLLKPGGGLYLTGKCPKLNTVSGLESIIFLKGNKDPNAVQSEKRPPRKDSTPAGANADYAWITLWTDWDANKDAWSCPDRPLKWYNNVLPESNPARGLWNQFIDRCHPRNTPALASGASNVVLDQNPSLRPQHGPAFDYNGAPGQTFLNAVGNPIKHIGRGAGCLVEGFEVLYNESKGNWSNWP